MKSRGRDLQIRSWISMSNVVIKSNKMRTEYLSDLSMKK